MYLVVAVDDALDFGVLLDRREDRDLLGLDPDAAPGTAWDPDLNEGGVHEVGAALDQLGVPDVEDFVVVVVSAWGTKGTGKW